MRPINDQVIDLSVPYTSFSDHLNQKNNHNIVFSAPFGAGKSFFLQHFFDRDEIKETYDAIIISPVNYVVSSNDRIFDLIKIDIFFNLVLKGYLDENDNLVSKYKEFKTLYGLDSLELIPFLLSAAASMTIDPKISTVMLAGGTILEAINKVKEKITSLEKKRGRKNPIQYINRFIEEKNSWIENNFFTQIIHEVVSNSDKKMVLVIDDMDRLDADHLFRIFNVFSAHYNDNNKNKLGFEKIVFVCDMENAKSIYEHRNGIDSNFKGYFDKFYSQCPFEFDNTKEIVEFIENKFKIHATATLGMLINPIIKVLYSSNKITLRTLSAIEEYQLPEKESLNLSDAILIDGICQVPNTYQDEIISWHWLVPLLGGFDGLEKAFPYNSASPRLRQELWEMIVTRHAIFSVLTKSLIIKIKAAPMNMNSYVFEYPENHSSDAPIIIEGLINYSKKKSKVIVNEFIIHRVKFGLNTSSKDVFKIVQTYVKTLASQV